MMRGRGPAGRGKDQETWGDKGRTEGWEGMMLGLWGLRYVRG